MFCPQCSNEILSERVRFCTRCSFPVGVVKELVESEAVKDKVEGEKKSYPLRQPDISIGAGLMIIGLVKAILVSSAVRGIRLGELMALTLTLGLFFSAALLFSQLSPRRRGLTLGATIVFLGALFGVAAGLVGWGPPTLLSIVGIFLLVSLFWMQLSGVFMRLFFDKELTIESRNHAPLHPEFKAVDTVQPLLHQMQSYAAIEPHPQELKTIDPVQPFSITENSTSLLKEGGESTKREITT